MEEALREYETHLHLAKDYLLGRGISGETAREFRLGVVPDSDDRWGKHTCGRLVLPFLSPAGVVDLKFRSLREHEKPKYVYASQGTTLRLFNAQALLRRSATYVLTEGELDAISVQQTLHLPSVAYPGASSWKPHFTRCFYGCAEVVIVADGDDPGRDAAKTIAKQLGQMADLVRIAECPEGMDANAVLVQHGPDALKEIING